MKRLEMAFLLANAIIWSAYGGLLIVYPGLLSDLGVFDQSSWVTEVEVRAMYGGAQLALGVFAIVALVKNQHIQSALLFFSILFTGLAVSRLAGIMLVDGVFALSFSGQPEAYNSGALWLFEVPMMALGWLLVFADRR
jgi:hypothetical protein